MNRPSISSILPTGSAVDSTNADLKIDQIEESVFKEVSTFKIELIEKLLSHDDLISLMFLVCDDISMYSVLLETGKTPPITKWVSCDSPGLIKLLEGLCITKNYKVLKHFGVNKYDAYYIFTHAESSISPAKKVLYSICNNCTPVESAKAINSLECGELNYSCLELLFIDWICKNAISITLPYALDRVTKLVSTIGNEQLSKELTKFTSQYELVKFDNDVQQNAANFTEDESYPIFDTDNVGLCIIVNQENFAPEGMSARVGSLLDVATLIKTMKHFNFKTDFLKSFNANELENYLTTTIKQKFEPKHSILFIIIMSHGVEGAVYGYDGLKVSIKEIKTAIQNSKCINGRPIVLIIQACQGKQIYSPIESDDPKISIVNDLNNLLVCMPSSPGFLSLRHIEKGTFYIQTLCQIMRQYEYDDMYSILTRLQSRLSCPDLYQKNNAYKVAMLPEFHSRLQKKLYLKKRP
ncbi:caspase-8-like isoform X2 [Cimex lectularius]|uniref:Uncharacterized protein n=1 Tax=Cimex lectularius TaxID=79782 RepID=A0A8I6TB63_CIMLE|nr:caspase-8-like isoform X2 [Cimex lectularius]